MADYVPRLVHLPGTRLSPEVMLHRTLDKLDRIKGIALVIQWDDESFDTDWSAMKVSELCMASMVLTETVKDVAMGRLTDCVTVPGNAG